MIVYKVTEVIKNRTQKGDEVYTIELNNNLYVKYINLNEIWASSGKTNVTYFGSLYELIKFHDKFGIESLKGNCIEADITNSNFGLQFENVGILDIVSELKKIIRSSDKGAFTVFTDTPSFPSYIINMLRLMNKIPRKSDGSFLITTTTRKNKIRIIPISKDISIRISRKKGYRHETKHGLFIVEEFDSNKYVTLNNINDIFQDFFSGLDNSKTWRANAGEHTESIVYSVLDGSIVKTKYTSFCSDSFYTNKDRRDNDITILVTIGDKKLNTREDYLIEYRKKIDETKKVALVAEVEYQKKMKELKKNELIREIEQKKQNDIETKKCQVASKARRLARAEAISLKTKERNKKT